MKLPSPQCAMPYISKERVEREQRDGFLGVYVKTFLHKMKHRKAEKL